MRFWFMPHCEAMKAQASMTHQSLCCMHSSGQKYFNIALVLQGEWLTVFTRPANTCTCPLKAYAIQNIRE